MESRLTKPHKDSEIKNCPFCGGNDIWLEEYETEVGNRFRILCAGCMAMIDNGWAMFPHTVIDLWNARAN